MSSSWLATTRRAAFALVLLMLLTEGALRLAGVVRLGLRRAALPEAGDSRGVVRILHVGESTTYGLGVRPEQAYPAVLEELLAQRDPDRRFVTYNRGVPGLTTTGMLRSFDAKLLTLQPTVVVLMAGANDFNERLNHLWGPDDWLPRSVRTFVEDLRLYKFARLALELSRPGVRMQDGEILYFRQGASLNILYDEPRDESRVAEVTARLEANLEEMIRRARDAGAGMLLVGYIQSHQENQILQRAAARTEIPYVSTFIAPDRRTPGLFVEDGWHPSPEGHRHIASRIAESISDEDVLTAALPVALPSVPSS